MRDLNIVFHKWTVHYQCRLRRQYAASPRKQSLGRSDWTDMHHVGAKYRICFIYRPFRIAGIE